MGWINVSFLYMAFVHQMVKPKIFLHTVSLILLFIFFSQKQSTTFCWKNSKGKDILLQKHNNSNIFLIMHRIEDPFFEIMPTITRFDQNHQKKMCTCFFHILSSIVLILQYATVHLFSFLLLLESLQAVNAADQLKTHISGVIAHGQNEFYTFLDVGQYPHDSNLTINIIIMVLFRLKDKMVSVVIKLSSLISL